MLETKKSYIFALEMAISRKLSESELEKVSKIIDSLPPLSNNYNFFQKIKESDDLDTVKNSVGKYL